MTPRDKAIRVLFESSVLSESCLSGMLDRLERAGLVVVGRCEGCKHQFATVSGTMACDHWKRGAPNGDGCTRWEARER